MFLRSVSHRILQRLPRIFGTNELVKYSIMSSFEVQHDEKAKQFFITLGEEKAVIEYTKEGEDTLNMWHTEVPISHRGQGIAAHLAKAAFDYTVDNNLKLRPTCTYLQKYIKDHPLPQYTERALPPQ